MKICISIEIFDFERERISEIMDFNQFFVWLEEEGEFRTSVCSFICCMKMMNVERHDLF